MNRDNRICPHTVQRLEALARILDGDVASIVRGGDPGSRALAADIRALITPSGAQDETPIASPRRLGAGHITDAQLEAMARAHDEMEAAYRGEPTPWHDGFSRSNPFDAVWRSQRLAAMRCAVEALNLENAARVRRPHFRSGRRD